MVQMRDREGVVTELTDRFESGGTLTTADIGKLITNYGYSENTAADVITNARVAHALAQRGIELIVERHLRSNIYRDGRLPVEKTDLEDTKQRLDQEEIKRLAKIRQTTYNL
jgi:hypothetical protein